MCGKDLFMTLCAVASLITSTCCSRVDITVQPPEAFPDVYDLSCEQNGTSVICPDLDTAINYSTVFNLDGMGRIAGNASFVSISLPKGTHYITTRTYFGDTSVSFVGVDSDVTVVCDYYADNGLSSPREMQTWYFDASESVEMTNLHFKDCGFPFRLFTVKDVIIENCTFT